MKKKSNILVYLALIVLVCIFIFPVIWVVLSSIKDSTELYSWPPKFIPDHPTLKNFITAFEKGNFGSYFLNSTFVTVTATILTLLVNTMAGYALAKYRFKGDTWLLIGFISTLMIPLEVIMTPIFTVISKLGLYNSLWGIIIPPAATPTGVFLIRQYLLTVPNELIEAARIDGAGEWKIFWKLIVPIAKPIISVLAIFSFMWRWDDFIWPLIVISDPTKYTVQLALSNFIGEYNVDWGSLLAMSVVTMIPVLIVFLIFQKQFIQGMATSGMKD
ncbi:carbohydrate ABC transporter permease [Neobacillus terrae]|uniref:carbohydrate ABC transporter permease n=1 Tax=Neobacillus terrae TaxID=3034837 RepID=UPI001FB12B00|nr:carbohydrate ABC transporter permease [Neobacillus terrae]